MSVGLVPAAQNPSLDYAQWRGPQRDGGAAGFVKPQRWPAQLQRRWRVDVGEGYGTPLLVGDMAYVFARRADNEVMMALRAGTGDIVWQTPYAAPFSPAYNARAHGAGPKATPLFHNGKLYALGINGTFTAFDPATGRILWQKLASAPQPEYGAASSPIGDQGLVMVHPGAYGPLTAFDATTGELRWRGGDDGVFASPIIAELAGTRQLVTVTQRNIAGLSLSDGKVLWQFRWPRDIAAITPVQFGDLVIVGSQNESVKALKVTRRGGGFSVALGWESQDIGLYMSNPVVMGGVLFGLSRRASGQLFALDAATGATLWLGPPRQGTQAAVVKADGLLFLLGEDGELTVATGGRSGIEPTTRYTVSTSAVWAQPAISGNRMLVKDTSALTLWTID